MKKLLLAALTLGLANVNTQQDIARTIDFKSNGLAADLANSYNALNLSLELINNTLGSSLNTSSILTRYTVTAIGNNSIIS